MLCKTIHKQLSFKTWKIDVIVFPNTVIIKLTKPCYDSIDYLLSVCHKPTAKTTLLNCWVVKRPSSQDSENVSTQELVKMTKLILQIIVTKAQFQHAAPMIEKTPCIESTAVVTYRSHKAVLRPLSKCA